jgi:hypothetical protein
MVAGCGRETGDLDPFFLEEMRGQIVGGSLVSRSEFYEKQFFDHKKRHKSVYSNLENSFEVRCSWLAYVVRALSNDVDRTAWKDHIIFLIHPSFLSQRSRSLIRLSLFPWGLKEVLLLEAH